MRRRSILALVSSPSLGRHHDALRKRIANGLVVVSKPDDGRNKNDDRLANSTRWPLASSAARVTSPDSTPAQMGSLGSNFRCGGCQMVLESRCKRRDSFGIDIHLMLVVKAKCRRPNLPQAHFPGRPANQNPAYLTHPEKFPPIKSSSPLATSFPKVSVG